MQRIATLLAACAPALVGAQEPGVAQLWELAGTTLPVAPALATGGASVVWNPAQAPPGGRASVCLEFIQTPTAINATGVLVVSRLRVRRVGELGLIYGSMEMSDLIRTESSALDLGPIPYYSQFIAGSWTLTRGHTTLGATVGLQDIKVDRTQRQRASLDLGIAQLLPWDFRIAASGHLFTPLATGDRQHDVYGGVERRMWRGTLWRGSGPVSFTARYGIAVGQGFSADHQFGTGIEVGNQLVIDMQVARVGGYGVEEWRGTAGVRVRIGRYRVSYARDTGMSGIGSAYRVGIEAHTN